ncbi:MAG TPA: DUF1360 domain-containing protein [Candidatus Paceibacterota bacterium]|jgi:hypothetical protein|nr:DUF1360 domain-containing protein [Candidatus Paceibacterota bacterium]
MHIQRPKEDQNFWNFLFSIFFVIVLAAAVYEMYQMRGGFLVSVPWFDAIVMAFATFRITRLVVYDKITRWFRELFASTRSFEQDGVVYVEVKPHGTGFRSTVYDLLNCPWCIGVWSSLVVVFCYFVFPWAWSVIFFLALAGAGSLIQVVANSIGWRAENLKMEAKEKDRDLRL